MEHRELRQLLYGSINTLSIQYLVLSIRSKLIILITLALLLILTPGDFTPRNLSLWRQRAEVTALGLIRSHRIKCTLFS